MPSPIQFLKTFLNSHLSALFTGSHLPSIATKLSTRRWMYWYVPTILPKISIFKLAKMPKISLFECGKMPKISLFVLQKQWFWQFKMIPDYVNDSINHSVKSHCISQNSLEAKFTSRYASEPFFFLSSMNGQIIHDSMSFGHVASELGVHDVIYQAILMDFCRWAGNRLNEFYIRYFVSFLSLDENWSSIIIFVVFRTLVELSI